MCISVSLLLPIYFPMMGNRLRQRIFSDLHEKLQILAQGAQSTQSTAKLCKQGTWWCARARGCGRGRGRGGSCSRWISAEGNVVSRSKAEGGAVILLTSGIVIQSLQVQIER